MKKVLVALVSGLVAMLACELLHRAWLADSGTAYSAAATRLRLEELLDPTASYLPATPAATEPVSRTASVLHPYAGAEAEHDTGGVLAYFREERAEADYTVVVVGGSVAAAWATVAGAEFERLVQAHPRLADRRVRLLNYAHAAYKQPQQVMRIAYLFSLGHRPDVVINLDGFNEVGLGLNNSTSGIHPVYPSFPVWGFLISELEGMEEGRLEILAEMFDLRRRAGRTLATTLDWNLHRSSVLGQLMIGRMARQAQRRAALQALLEQPSEQGPEADRDRAQSGPDFERDLDSVFELMAANWTESSRSLHALCRSRSIEYLHVLQPTLFDVGSKPRSADERLHRKPPGWSRGARRGYPLLRGRIPELRSEGVEVFDASMIFEHETDTLYKDACHVNQRGNQLLNEAIVGAFLDFLER